ncbi:ATP synthase regulation protein nca2 [Scedosporium apiospermum]|uniref:ATP synthase regulation protein nca2 n=1 Tax=Pseudallescheria apiosperma TaxID=563466 RepID=A0A084G1A0_PSEDA|nr:ATP synthase regulation protein nca2 [Scedosporium apiospermum]KEZ41112.1 ATP synthase regulation protein nca2 [Scedosporium apiospermum]
MSVIGDRVWAINTQLNSISRDHDLFVVTEDEQVSLQEQGVLVATALESPRVAELVRIFKALSTPSSSDPLLPTWRIEQLLIQSQLAMHHDTFKFTPGAVDGELPNPFETEIEWLLLAKAAMQIYGAILQTLIDQNISLEDHLWYWDDISRSYRLGFLLWLQKSPLQLWSFTRDVYYESTHRIRSMYSPELKPEDELDEEHVAVSRKDSIKCMSMSDRWRKFYHIVRTTVQDRSLVNIQDRILSPIALCQAEAREKAYQIRRLKENIACGVGALVHEGLDFNRGEWKDVLERSVSLMETVMVQTANIDGTVSDFEEGIFRFVDNDPELLNQLDEEQDSPPRRLANRLLTILQHRLPRQAADTRAVIKTHGRPSIWVRYWLPATIGLLSSSMILRFLTNRKADIIQAIADLGLTVRDFWSNWVIDPARKIIKTIRHDENRELTLMSRDSLRADLESLERMVVDFAVDKPHFATADGSAVALTDAQVADIRSRVVHGDVTPVLKAYEKDLRKPFIGAVKGDLVRSLLIQVQKSKVDMEVALGGIDALLKSQELVFGFVSLTPGILISVGVYQYIRGVMSGRVGLRQRDRTSKTMRAVRTINRMLAKADLTPEKTMTYEQIGNLLCQVHILRNIVPQTMPQDTRKDFLIDLDELVNLRVVPFQKKTMEDIVLTYAKWLL